MGSPSNEDAKIHTFYLCKLDTSQFPHTQENMKERQNLTKSLWHQNGGPSEFKPFKLNIRNFQNR